MPSWAPLCSVALCAPNVPRLLFCPRHYCSVLAEPHMPDINFPFLIWSVRRLGYQAPAATFLSQHTLFYLRGNIPAMVRWKQAAFPTFCSHTCYYSLVKAVSFLSRLGLLEAFLRTDLYTMGNPSPSPPFFLGDGQVHTVFCNVENEHYANV